MCLVDFVTNYVHHKAFEQDIDSEDIRSYTTAVSILQKTDNMEMKTEIITLQSKIGIMRKRSWLFVM